MADFGVLGELKAVEINYSRESLIPKVKLSFLLFFQDKGCGGSTQQASTN